MAGTTSDTHSRTLKPRSITLAWLHERAPTEALNAFVAAALRSTPDPR